MTPNDEVRRAVGLLTPPTDTVECAGRSIRIATCIHLGATDTAASFFRDDWNITLESALLSSDGLVSDITATTTQYHTGVGLRRGRKYPGGGVWRKGVEVRRPSAPPPLDVLYALLSDAVLWLDYGDDVDDWLADGLVELTGARPVRAATEVIAACRRTADQLQAFLRLSTPMDLHEAHTELNRRYEP